MRETERDKGGSTRLQREGGKDRRTKRGRAGDDGKTQEREGGETHRDTAAESV